LVLVMAIRLRLAIHGLRNNRFFHLVAIDHRKARNAKPAELLGIYKPRIEGVEGSKTLEWSVSRIKYWLEKGATPSKSVLGLLEQVCISNDQYLSLTIGCGIGRHLRARITIFTSQ